MTRCIFSVIAIVIPMAVLLSCSTSGQRGQTSTEVLMCPKHLTSMEMTFNKKGKVKSSQMGGYVHAVSEETFEVGDSRLPTGEWIVGKYSLPITPREIASGATPMEKYGTFDSQSEAGSHLREVCDKLESRFKGIRLKPN